jgi:hypothetical protein
VRTARFKWFAQLDTIQNLHTCNTTFLIFKHASETRYFSNKAHFNIMHIFYLRSEIALTGYFLLCTVNDRNNILFWYHCHMLPVEFWDPVHFLLRQNIKRGNHGIIVYIFFYYLIQNINVDGLMWFFWRINTILMQYLKM